MISIREVARLAGVSASTVSPISSAIELYVDTIASYT